MIHIPLNASVRCLNGPGGESTQIIINPTTQKISYVVVREETEGHVERLVPVDRVLQTTSNTIDLKCTVAELATLEPFVETHYIHVDSPEYMKGSTYLALPYAVLSEPEFIKIEQSHVPPEQLAIRRGTGVQATDGWVGTIDEFLIDPESGNVTHLVLREGHLWGKKDLTLPVSAIEKVFDDSVYLKLDKKTIEKLPAVPARHSFGWKDARFELIIMVFQNVSKAQEALNFLQDLRREKKIGPIRNAAVLEMDETGRASLKETQDVDSKQGTLFGAITGGLIGLIGGPVGMVVGAAAGALTGRAAAGRIDMGFSNRYLIDVEKRLEPGSSALIALVEHEWSGDVAESLTYLGGQLFRQALTDEIVKEITAETENGPLQDQSRE
jgi:uncharacterized membrane protein/sporulation protein YlmC with PRC-barrel domain